MAINKTSDLKHLTFTVTYCGLLFGISNQIWIRHFYNIHILNAEKTEIAREIGISFLLLFSGTEFYSFPVLHIHIWLFWIVEARGIFELEIVACKTVFTKSIRNGDLYIVFVFATKI